jgi:hypothetical protein
VADRLQHRQVGDRVAVGPAVGQVPAPLGGDLPHRGGLVLPVGVELDLAGVPAVDGHHPGGDHPVDAEHLPDRADHLGAGAGDDHDLPARRAVLLDQVGGLGVDQRVHDLVQRLPDDVVHDRDVPPRRHGGDLPAHPFHLVGVRAGQREDELRVGALEHGTTVDQPALEERPAEGQGAGLGDDRLVQVEERCGAGHIPHGKSIGSPGGRVHRRPHPDGSSTDPAGPCRR